MYFATMSLMLSPFARILTLYLDIPQEQADPIFGLFNLLLVVALPAYDRLAHGKVEPISWIALGVLLVAQISIVVLRDNAGWNNLMFGT